MGQSKGRIVVSVVCGGDGEVDRVERSVGVQARSGRTVDARRDFERVASRLYLRTFLMKSVATKVGRRHQQPKQTKRSQARAYGDAWNETGRREDRRGGTEGRGGGETERREGMV